MNPSPNPPPYSPSDPRNSHDPSPPATLPSPPVIQTGHSSVTELNCNSPPCVAPSEQDGGQNAVQNSDPSDSQPPVSDPVFSLASRLHSSPVSNPYPGPVTPPSYQVSVIIPSPDLRPSPLPSPDLECSICFSQFNNVFRCPKMLQCKHTFCLECLARINVKAAQPNAIQCPLCRGFTPLPDLGLPKLTTDSDVLSYLPAAMQRVYSIRFLRNKGKLQVKRAADNHRRWGQRSVNRSLDVGLPSPPAVERSSEQPGGLVEALFRLTGRPMCRAFLLTSVLMMMGLLTGIIIFLLTFQKVKE
ncbi:RING finger protein 223 [Labrus mixtus]|uniref:RING finger protein 223 n=1 Tax=Labrus mixtus TaxID=508554 RepID=UPI0029C06179|nr:RING finger protein 223 [Labrus mixtus]